MTTLEINMFGGFDVFEGGAAIKLPPSKKARALLAYLIVTGRAHRREHLCELFWDTPHDPKGSLRWALSKLRAALGNHRDRFFADREHVSFDISGLTLQALTIERIIESNRPEKAALLSVIETLEGEFLAGLDFSRMDEFSIWLAKQREYALRLRGQILDKCLQSDAFTPAQALGFARERLACQPYDITTAKSVLGVLKQKNFFSEAARFETDLTAHFKKVEIAFSPDTDSQAAKDAFVQQDRKLLSHQKIQFCKTAKGVSLAYASVGNGPPLVKAANWLTHLELDWSAPIWSPLYRELAQDFTFIRYDGRGNGLSEWDIDTLSQEIFVKDLECVADNLGLEKFPLLGISQGAAVSIEYAIRHPERVSKLVLFGGYPTGWKIDATPDVVMQREAMITLTKTGWGQNNPAYRHVFSSTFMPTASPQDLAWFDDFQRRTTSPDNAVKFLQAFAEIDVRHHLSKISVPTLVIHSRGDQRIDWQVGRDIAAAIPNAEFVTLDSDNHLLLDGEPAADQFLSAVRAFLLD